MVAGGVCSTHLKDPELHDPATGTWTVTGSMATGRAEHTATLLSSGKVLVAGGEGDPNILSSAELYDPVSGTWTGTGSMGTARAYHTATLLASGKVLVVGGTDLNSAELYDPASGSWTATGSTGARRYILSVTRRRCSLSGNVLVAGGRR